MAEQALALREYPQIIELLAVIEQNGPMKERDEVSSLVEYIGSIQCTRLLDTAQEKVTQTGEMVSTVKKNFVRAAGNAVKTFKEKGRAALVQAVRAMKIPVVLAKMKNGFHAAARSMNEAAGKVEMKREQQVDICKMQAVSCLGNRRRRPHPWRMTRVFWQRYGNALRIWGVPSLLWKIVSASWRRNCKRIIRSKSPL